MGRARRRRGRPPCSTGGELGAGWEEGGNACITWPGCGQPSQLGPRPPHHPTATRRTARLHHHHHPLLCCPVLCCAVLWPRRKASYGRQLSVMFWRTYTDIGEAGHACRLRQLEAHCCIRPFAGSSLGVSIWLPGQLQQRFPGTNRGNDSSEVLDCFFNARAAAPAPLLTDDSPSARAAARSAQPGPALPALPGGSGHGPHHRAGLLQPGRHKHRWGCMGGWGQKFIFVCVAVCVCVCVCVCAGMCSSGKRRRRGAACDLVGRHCLGAASTHLPARSAAPPTAPQASRTAWAAPSSPSPSSPSPRSPQVRAPAPVPPLPSAWGKHAAATEALPCEPSYCDGPSCAAPDHARAPISHHHAAPPEHRQQPHTLTPDPAAALPALQWTC